MTARVQTFAPNGRSGRVTGAHPRFNPREKSVTVNAQFPPDIVSSIRVSRTAKKAYDLSAITRVVSHHAWQLFLGRSIQRRV